MINRKPIIEGIIAGAIGLAVVGSGITFIANNSNKESKDVTTKLEETSTEENNQENETEENKQDNNETQSDESLKLDENKKKTEENNQVVKNTSTNTVSNNIKQEDNPKQEQTKTEVKQPDAPTKIRFRDDNISFPGGKKGAKQAYDYLLAHKDKYLDADEELAKLQEEINRKIKFSEEGIGFEHLKDMYDYLKENRDKYSDADEIIAQLEKEHPEFVTEN